MSQPTTTPTREIAYDAETRDFALYLNGELVGFARSYADGERVIDEILAERGKRGQLAAAELNAAEAQAEAQAEAARLLAELNQISGQWDASLAEGRDELARVLKGAYGGLSARVRALGFEIGPDGRGGLCLWCADNTGPLHVARRAA